MTNEYKILKPYQKGLFTGLIEVWKPIEGYEGNYEISSFGNVKSCARFRMSRGGFSPIREKILKRKLSDTGYYQIGLCKDGIKKYFSIHRLVAKAFIPNPLGKPTVNHIIPDKLNNKVSNLEWSTSKEQATHAVENNLFEIRGAPKYSKVFKQEIHQYFIDNKCSIADLARKYNISSRTAGRIASGVNVRPTTRVLKDGTRIIEPILSKEDVAKIKELRSQGKTLVAISQLFNRGISQIHRITKNQSRVTEIE